jgi:hypothetical protein
MSDKYTNIGGARVKDTSEGKLEHVRKTFPNVVRTTEEGHPIFDSPSYNKEAVNKEIKRSKQKIGSSEAKAIHGLLKGRHAKGGHINLKDCEVSTHEKNPKHKHCW